MVFSLRTINYYANQKVPGLFITLNKKTYLINCPELVQRYLSLKSVTITENTDIIITNTDLEYHSGLQGMMCQTAARNLKKGTNIFLPLQIANYIDYFDYVFGKTFLNFSFCGIFDGKNIQSSYGLPLESDTSQKLNLPEFNDWEKKFKQLLQWQNKDLFNAEKHISSQSKFVEQDIIDNFNLAVISQDECEIIFIPQNTKKSIFSLLIIPFPKNNLDKQKLKQYNIIGKEVGKLQKDKQIQINDEVYTLDFFYIKNTIPNALMIFDIESNIDQQYQQQNIQLINLLYQQKSFNLNYVVHLYNDEVFNNPLYKIYSEFFNSLGVNNMFVNQVFEENYDPLQNHYYYLNQAHQHLPYIFPKFPQNLQNKQYLLDQFYKNYTKQNGLVIYSIKDQIIKSQDIKIHYDQQKRNYLDLVFNYNNNPLLQQYNNLLSKKNDFKNFPFFVFLGTGSQNPNSYRNVTSILVGINENCLILLDCGEGTYIQLLNQFGENTDEIISKIKFIYLTHIHGDHTFGTFQIIEKRKQILDKKGQNDPLIICGPNNTRRMFVGFEEKIGFKDAYYFITLEKLMEIQNIQIPEFYNYFTKQESIYEQLPYWNYRYKDQTKELSHYNFKYWNIQIQQHFIQFVINNNIKQILPIPVKHCAQSSGVKLQLQNKSIVYSGDCQQSNHLSKYGKNCDLMIHECTLDCQFTPQEVIDKGHSDPSIALNIANNAQAKNLILTHFSQRYKYSSPTETCSIKIFRENKNLQNYFKNNCLMARDHLYVDFEIMDIMCKIHNEFNKFLFLDLDLANKQIQQF